MAAADKALNIVKGMVAVLKGDLVLIMTREMVIVADPGAVDPSNPRKEDVRVYLGKREGRAFSALLLEALEHGKAYLDVRSAAAEPRPPRKAATQEEAMKLAQEAFLRAAREQGAQA